MFNCGLLGFNISQFIAAAVAGSLRVAKISLRARLRLESGQCVAVWDKYTGNTENALTAVELQLYSRKKDNKGTAHLEAMKSRNHLTSSSIY